MSMRSVMYGAYWRLVSTEGWRWVCLLQTRRLEGECLLFFCSGDNFVCSVHTACLHPWRGSWRGSQSSGLARGEVGNRKLRGETKTRDASEDERRAACEICRALMTANVSNSIYKDWWLFVLGFRHREHSRSFRPPQTDCACSKSTDVWQTACWWVGIDWCGSRGCGRPAHRGYQCRSGQCQGLTADHSPERLVLNRVCFVLV